MTGSKFSFYLSAPLPSADVVTEVEQAVAEDKVTTYVEESYSSSTYEEGVETSVAVKTQMQSSSDTIEEEVVDDEVVPGDEESVEEESPSVVEEVSSEEPVAGSEASQKSAEFEEEDIVEEGEEEGPKEEAYKSCAEEECIEEEEKTKVTQTHSDTSEVTYESAPPPLLLMDVASTCSVSTTSTKDHTPKPTPSSTVSSKLSSMMFERIQAMDNIRRLLKDEHEQENGIRAGFTEKVRVLEEDIISKDENIFDLKAENGDYVRQLGRLSSKIIELVDSNHENIERMAELELDVAVKTNTIKEMNEDTHDKQFALDKKTDENVVLVQQLSTFKAENEGLKATIEDLQAKNTDFTNESENLMSSLHELIDQNTTLQGQVEELIYANNKLEDVIVPTEQKNAELLDTVDDLTSSLNAAKSHHKKEVDKLQKENELTEKKMKKEQDSNAATIHQLEITLEQTTAQMTDQLSAQKATFEKQVSGLTKSIDDANASCQKKAKRNDKLQKEIEDVGRSTARLAEDAAATIGQLEKDLEMEFQITTQLKRGMEDLMKKSQKEEDDKYTDDMEDLLSSLRMIQCGQLSHFQRINKLVSENKEQARSIQLLS